MFRYFLDLLKKQLLISEKIQQSKSDINDIRKELKDVSEKMLELKFEVQRNQENEKHEREKLLLQVENKLLTLHRLLPSEKNEQKLPPSA